MLPLFFFSRLGDDKRDAPRDIALCTSRQDFPSRMILRPALSPSVLLDDCRADEHRRDEDGSGNKRCVTEAGVKPAGDPVTTCQKD
jgi:hypothetical protein